MLRALRLQGAHPTVQCAAAGHVWPQVWEFVPGEIAGNGRFRRACECCQSVEEYMEWAWLG